MLRFSSGKYCQIYKYEKPFNIKLGSPGIMYKDNRMNKIYSHKKKLPSTLHGRVHWEKINQWDSHSRMYDKISIKRQINGVFFVSRGTVKM